MQIIGILLVAALFVFAIKIAVIVLFLAGLIFRTQATLSLIAVLGAMALLRNYPVICFTLIGVVVVFALARAGKDKPPTLPDG